MKEGLYATAGKFVILLYWLELRKEWRVGTFDRWWDRWRSVY